MPGVGVDQGTHLGGDVRQRREGGVGVAELRRQVAEGDRFTSIELDDELSEVVPGTLETSLLARSQRGELLVPHDAGRRIRAGQARGVRSRYGDRVRVGRDRGRQVVGAGRDPAGIEGLRSAGRPDIQIASGIARPEGRERDLGDVAGRDRYGRLGARGRLPNPVGLRDLDVIGARSQVAARSAAARRRERRSARGPRSRGRFAAISRSSWPLAPPAWNCAKVVPEGTRVGEA